MPVRDAFPGFASRVAFACGALAAACSNAPPAAPAVDAAADTLYVGGDIGKIDDAQPVAEALAVEGGVVEGGPGAVRAPWRHHRARGAATRAAPAPSPHGAVGR